MKRNWLYVIMAGVQIIVALSPVIPRLNAIWGEQPNPVDVLSVNFAVLAVLIPILLLWELQPTRKAIEDLKGKHPEAAWEKASAFYQRFTADIKHARDFVDIAYMAAYPPAETADEMRKRYYLELPTLMRRRSEISFRRLVRDSQKNRRWIAKMLTEMSGARNFALAVISDDETEEHSLALSAQIIDNETAWLVALRSHEPGGGPRDLFIKSEVIATGLRGYYERIWNRSRILMRAGNLTEAGVSYVESAK